MHLLTLLEQYDTRLAENEQQMLNVANPTGQVQACQDLLEVMRDMVLNNCDVSDQAGQLVGLLGWQAKHLVDKHTSMLKAIRELFVQLGCLGC